jgi:hypothetical protein
VQRLELAAAERRQDVRLGQLAIAVNGRRLMHRCHMRQPALDLLGEREPLRLEQDAVVATRQLGP